MIKTHERILCTAGELKTKHMHFLSLENWIKENETAKIIDIKISTFTEDNCDYVIIIYM